MVLAFVWTVVHTRAMAVRERFLLWVAWLGVSEAEVARRLKCDASYPRRIRLGERRPGIDVASSIETETAKPREDGETWPGGPIRASEWAEHDTSLTDASTVEESAA